MTAFEIVVSCVGMILCALICSLCVVVIAGMCWWAFKRDMQEELEQDNERNHTTTKDFDCQEEDSWH